MTKKSLLNMTANVLLLSAVAWGSYMVGRSHQSGENSRTIRELQRRTTCSGSRTAPKIQGTYEGQFVEPAVPRPSRFSQQVK